jgi:hypothetical protein
MSHSTIFRGIVHGKTIELDQELGLPEGQSVEVTVQPVSHRPFIAGAYRPGLLALAGFKLCSYQLLL